MEDKYVVIKEEWLRKLLSQAGYTEQSSNEWLATRSLPAQQLWDAAQFNRYLPNNMNDFLTEQFYK